jgi:hypothetical protein
MPVPEIPSSPSSRRVRLRSLNGRMEACLLARILHHHGHQQDPVFQMVTTFIFQVKQYKTFGRAFPLRLPMSVMGGETRSQSS